MQIIKISQEVSRNPVGVGGSTAAGVGMVCHRGFCRETLADQRID